MRGRGGGQMVGPHASTSIHPRVGHQHKGHNRRGLNH